MQTVGTLLDDYRARRDAIAAQLDELERGIAAGTTRGWAAGDNIGIALAENLGRQILLIDEGIELLSTIELVVEGDAKLTPEDIVPFRRLG